MTTTVKQPPFEPEIVSTLHWPLMAKKERLRRGYMIWDKSQMPPGYGTAAQVNFLYNPSEVSASYTMQYAASATQQFRNPGDSANLVVPMQQTVNFTLLFDRTYAFWDNIGGDLAEFGVDVDVNAMKQFTGMFVNNDQQANATGQAAGLMQGVMGRVNSYLHFAQGRQGLSYYGFVDSWDVTYTHFSNNMIPMRCSLDVSFTLLPPNQQQNNKKGVIQPGGPGGPVFGTPGNPQRPGPGPTPFASVGGR